MLKDLLLLLQQEWSTLKAAPVTFVLILILAFLAAFFALKWYYRGILETKNERLKAKDDQLDDYRQRLGLISASGSEFSRLNFEELKQRAIDLVTKIRQFLTQRQEESRRLDSIEWQQMQEAKTEEDRKRIWNTFINNQSQLSIKHNAEYDRQFKIDTILMRDEMLSRLPEHKKDERTYSMYEHPTNPIGMGMVADDLEKLAKSLK